MNSTPNTLNGKSWHHGLIRARVTGDRSIDTITGSTSAKPFATAYVARPTRRGAPPH